MKDKNLSAPHRPMSSKAELTAHWDNVFTATVSEYVRIRQLSPVVAHQFDPDPTVTSAKLTYDLVDYAVDIENATTAALKGCPLLQPVWFSIALGQPTDSKLAQQVISKCGRLYAARKLEPWAYYRPSRYAHRRAAA